MSDADNKDPSMDEILQSIKRIISEETDEKPASPQPQDDEDVLELTELVKDDGSVESIRGAAEADVLESIDRQMEVTSVPIIQEKVELEAVEMQMPEEPEAHVQPEPELEAVTIEAVSDESLISDNTVKASSEKLDRLREVVSEADAVRPAISSPYFRSGSTVEDLVLEALKPMLKDWLELNLPELVERIVEKEVRRISGR